MDDELHIAGVDPIDESLFPGVIAAGDLDCITLNYPNRLFRICFLSAAESGALRNLDFMCEGASYRAFLCLRGCELSILTIPEHLTQ